jgi:hypothetical protein
VAFAFAVVPALAQQPGFGMTNRPVGELFDAVERLTPHRVFAPDTPDLDSLRVSVGADESNVGQILDRVLAPTPFRALITDDGTIFILREGVNLATILPSWRHIDRLQTGEASYSVPSIDSLMASFVLAAEADRGADSGMRLYEVGDPEATPAGRVPLSGYVYDSASGEAVPGIMLQINDTNTVSISDRYGFYNFDLLPGRYEINISGAGQVDSKRQVQLYSAGTLDILTAEKVETLTAITVWGDRRDNVRQTAIGVERLAMADIRNMPMVFGEVDILRAVTSLPGVTAAGEISSGFNVRGGATDQNLILYNDGTIFNPTHLFGLFSAFNPDIVRDMELFKSSIPTRFGGRISSVLDIHSREGNKRQFAGSASLGLLTSRLTLEAPLWRDRTSFIVGGRTTYSDWILKELPEKSDYKNGNAGFWDVNATLSHRFNDRNNLFIDGYYSQDRFNFEEFEHYRYRNTNGSIKWRHVMDSRSWAVVTAGWDHYDHRISNSENEWTAYDLDFAIDQYFAKADFTIQVGEGHSLGFGLNTLYYDMSPGSYLPHGPDSGVVPDRMEKEKALESALYLSDKWTITDHMEIDYGLRWSMFNVLGPRNYTLYDPDHLPSAESVTETGRRSGVLKTWHGPEFRFSARYMLMDDLSVKVGVNSMRQYIHKISNNTVMSPTDTWKLSDVNIAPQRGVQYAAGINKDFRSQFIELSLEGYYKTLGDYLDYRSGARLMMNPHLERDLVSTNGRAYGVELMVRRTEGKLNGWASYTYSRTELRQDDPRILLPVNGGNWYPADFDKPHEVKVVGNYRFTHRFSLSVNAEYSTGRPITLPVASYPYAGGWYLYYSERNRYRIPDYFRLDASINIEPSHHLTLLTHSTITLGVYNVTGRKNAHSVYFKQEAGVLNGYKLSIFGVPIPYISYNIKF